MVKAETLKNYTKQQLEGLNKDSLIDLYLSRQDQMKELDKKMQLILEQMVTSNRARFGRSSEKLPVEGQIRFAEVDGKIVFFNEAEAVNDAEGPGDSDETAGSGDGKKKNKPPVKTKGQKEQALSKLPTRRVDHDIPADELEKLFGRDGWKRLPDEVYRRLEFIPAKVEVEEHHVAVYAAKDESHMEKAKHPAYLFRNSLVEGMKEDLKIAGCWAHARRKFYDAGQTVPKKIRNTCTAHLALRQIQAIYREEKHLKGLPPEERLGLRKSICGSSWRTAKSRWTTTPAKPVSKIL